MVDSILLELLLIDIEFLHDLIKFAVDDLLFILGHLDYELLVTLSVIYYRTSLRDKIFLFISELHLGVIRTDLEDLDELFEFDVSGAISLQWTKSIDILVEGIWLFLRQVVGNECCTYQDGRSTKEAVHDSLVLHLTSLFVLNYN